MKTFTLILTSLFFYFLTCLTATAQVAECQDITVPLDSFNGYQLDPLEVYAGDTGYAAISIEPSLFSCNELGANTVILSVTDQDGITTTCSSVVTVEEFPDPIQSLACNDQVNVYLAPGQQLEFTSDMILEGGPYYCPVSYDVVLEDADGITLPQPILSSDDIGETFIATVTGPPFASPCWGEVTVIGGAGVCVEDYAGNGVSGVEVAPGWATGSDGCVVVGDTSVEVLMPEKNDNLKTGVEVCDLIAIRKHVLGMELLDDPLKVLAADMNQDNNISTFDLVLVAQIIDETLQSGIEPWGFDPPSLAVPPLPTQVNLKAYKRGDVTQGDCGGILNDTVALQANDLLINAGESYTVAWRPKDFGNINGLQLEWQLDESLVEIDTVFSSLLTNFSEVNFEKTPDGRLLIVWFEPNLLEFGISIPENQLLLQIQFKALQDGLLSQAFNPGLRGNNLMVRADQDEAVWVNTAWEETIPVPVQAVVNAPFQIQIYPQPMHQSARVELTGPAGLLQWQLFDAYGRLHRHGRMSVTLDLARGDLPAGLYFLRLQDEEGRSISRPLIVQ